MTIVVARFRRASFSDTAATIDASPCPLVGLSCTQAASAAAVHTQSRAAVN
jgi:hypothetical protein